MKFKRSLSLLIILFIFLIFAESAASFAFFWPIAPKVRASVFGTVVGPIGGQYAPVPGALVEIRKEGKNSHKAETNKDGVFQIGGLDEGEWTIMIKRPGFSLYTGNFTLAKGEMKKLPHISLAPGGDLTMPITSGLPERVYIAFAKIEVSPYASNTTMWKKGAIAQGADPFTLDSNSPISTDPIINPYDTENQLISSNDNSLMSINPQNNGDVNYVKMDARPTWLHFNAAGTKLYVATDNNYVLIYDMIGQSVPIGSVQLPAPATDMKTTRDGRWLFISYGGIQAGITVVDTVTNTPVRYLKVPDMSNGEFGLPMAIAPSRDGMLLYVALSSMNSGEVIAIDAYTKQPVAKVAVGAQPVGMEISGDGSRLYVTNHNSASLSVLSTAPLAVLSTPRVGVSPARLAISPDGGKIYVACKGSNTVSVLSCATGSPIANIAVGSEPMGIAVTGDGSRVYVSNSGDGTVSIIDAAANYVIKTTKAQPKSRPYGVAIRP